MSNGYCTRIGEIIQAEKISSLSGARDIGGSVVTNSGRVVIAAGPSDGELNHPYRIVISDNAGKTFRDVFTMSVSPEVTYHTLGLTYVSKHRLLISMFGRNVGYRLSESPFGKALPFSMDYCGDNEAVVALSWDDGENWVVDKVIPLEKPENCHGMCGHGVLAGDYVYFPHSAGTCDPEGDKRHCSVHLSRLRIVSNNDGTFTCDYEHKFRELASRNDYDTLFSSETVYIPKLDESGFISFTRSYTPGGRGGPP